MGARANKLIFDSVNDRHHSKWAIQPVRSVIKPNQHAVNDIDRPPASVSSESGSGRPLDMIPLPGEAAYGEDVLTFRFRLDLREGSV